MDWEKEEEEKKETIGKSICYFVSLNYYSNWLWVQQCNQCRLATISNLLPSNVRVHCPLLCGKSDVERRPLRRVLMAFVYAETSIKDTRYA